jgi:hypothetical protein
MSEFDQPDPTSAERSTVEDEGEGPPPAALSDSEPLPVVEVRREWIDESELELGDETPPEPLLPAVNKHVGPETQTQRDARYREMRDNEEALLQAMREEFPNSVLAQAGAKELERDQRMEPIRAAFIKTKGEKK